MSDPRSCNECGASFQMSTSELQFLSQCSPRIGERELPIPPPTLCPPCRRQRRLAWRNERSLFRRSCDKCDQNVISMYPPEAPYRVYCPSCYWSDDWSHTDYGRDVDFTKPIFEQFQELLTEVPLISLINVNSENSNYCHRIYGGRNNYMSFIAPL